MKISYDLNRNDALILFSRFGASKELVVKNLPDAIPRQVYFHNMITN